MRILLSGSSGFIGSEALFYFQSQGHEIVRLLRGSPRATADAIFWDPDIGSFLKESFEGFDAVVSLAGESVFCRWTAAKKRKILFSRTVGTRLLSHILASVIQPPKVFLSASAVGFYGDRGEERLTEESSAGRGFLASVACEWEKASRPIAERGVRRIFARFGLCLSPKGGVLHKLIPLYRWGLGGRLGSGEQWMSWIDLRDLVRAISFCLENDQLQGAVNCVSPYPVRQKEFSHALAKSLHRPAFFHQPAWLLRLALGEMADDLLLASQRAFPEKLLQASFTFQHPHLEF